MIIWNEKKTFNSNINLHIGDAGACTEFGLRAKLCRTSEYIIKCTNLRLTPHLEWVDRVYIATDWSNKNYTAEITSMNRRPAWVTFRCHYKSTGPKMRIIDDLYRAEYELMDATETNIYSANRSEFANRLILLVAECWKESWELFHKATWGPKHRLMWWPVRIWAHREPKLAFDLEEGGQLKQVPGGIMEKETTMVDY